MAQPENIFDKKLAAAFESSVIQCLKVDATSQMEAFDEKFVKGVAGLLEEFERDMTVLSETLKGVQGKESAEDQERETVDKKGTRG